MMNAYNIYGSVVHNYGYLTSPMLSFINYYNIVSYKESLANTGKTSDGFLNINEYWNFLMNGYNSFNERITNQTQSNSKGRINYETDIVLDLANGVAGCFKNEILKIFGNDIKLEVIQFNT